MFRGNARDQTLILVSWARSHQYTQRELCFNKSDHTGRSKDNDALDTFSQHLTICLHTERRGARREVEED